MIALAAASDVLIPDLTTISRFTPASEARGGAQAFGLNLRECPVMPPDRSATRFWGAGSHCHEP
jgi:hypothetical protein